MPANVAACFHTSALHPAQYSWPGTHDKGLCLLPGSRFPGVLLPLFQAEQHLRTFFKTSLTIFPCCGIVIKSTTWARSSWECKLRNTINMPDCPSQVTRMPDDLIKNLADHISPGRGRTSFTVVSPIGVGDTVSVRCWSGSIVVGGCRSDRSKPARSKGLWSWCPGCGRHSEVARRLRGWRCRTATLTGACLPQFLPGNVPVQTAVWFKRLPQ